MGVTQMLTEFNLLWNNIMSNQAPGLSPYEISLLLTESQDITVNSICESFEQSESIISYLSPLVRQATIDTVSDATEYAEPADRRMHIVPNSKLFKLPDDLLYRTHEALQIVDECGGIRVVDIVPVTQDAFDRTMSDPFKRPNSRRALRLAFDYNVGESEGYNGRYSEIVCADNDPENTYKYTVRYISKPEPIVLVDLGTRSIDGVSTVNPCKLNENIQRRIIAKAVEIAKSVWS